MSTEPLVETCLFPPIRRFGLYRCEFSLHCAQTPPPNAVLYFAMCKGLRVSPADGGRNGAAWGRTARAAAERAQRAAARLAAILAVMISSGRITEPGTGDGSTGEGEATA